MAPSKEFEIGPFRIKINWLISVCVLFTAFAFIQLGLWQIGRADEKLLAQSEYEQQQQLNAIDIENITTDELNPNNIELRNLHVSLHGEYVNERSILITAQFFEGLIGFEVVTPFRLLDSDRIVLISRGWTSGILPPNTPPNLRPVYDIQNLTAQIRVPDSNERNLSSQIDAGQWPLRVRSIEIDILQEIFTESLFPYVVRLTEDQPGMLVRHWQETNVDINTNLSYAFQWFTFAALVVLASILASSNLIKLLQDPESKKFK